MKLVCCRECQYFVKDKFGDGTGLGQCKKIEDYKSKNPSEQALNAALIKLGNNPKLIFGKVVVYAVFWGNTEKRDCKKYDKRI